MDILFPISSANYNRKHGYYIQTKHKKTLKGGEKKADRLEKLGLEERHNDELPEFSFCLKYPRFGAEEIQNSKKHRQKEFPHKFVLSSQRTRKGAFFSLKILFI